MRGREEELAPLTGSQDVGTLGGIESKGTEKLEEECVENRGAGIGLHERGEVEGEDFEGEVGDGGAVRGEE